MKQIKHNRRHFIKSAGLGLLLFAGFIWDKLVRTEKKLTEQREVSAPFNPNKNICFQEGFIIVNSRGQTTVFSSHCTHLGCTINQSDGGLLVCPCHGSAFGIDGNPVKGPAVKPLKILPFSIDKATKQITVEI